VFEKLRIERRTQGGRGTCSVFAVTSAIEFALARQSAFERLSVEFLNWAANQASGHVQDGAFFSDLWSGFQAHGICLETEMPYAAEFNPDLQPPAEVQQRARARCKAGLSLHWIKEWDVKTGLTDAQLTAIKQTLTRGTPVCAGLRWPKNAQWNEGVLGMCAPAEVFDGHSVLLVGYKEDPAQPGGGMFIFRNTNNGGRDGFMPYVYAQAYMNDAVWIALTKSPGD
jgi:C1A family cysteine protease